MENLDVAVFIVVAILIGIWLWTRSLNQELDVAHQQLKDVMSKIIFIRTEEHNGIIFAYNIFNNDFVCQGKDLDELNTNFGIRFPLSRGIIVKPDEKEGVA